MEQKLYPVILTVVIIGVFILQALAPITELFVLNQLSFEQPYRFITAIFLHGSVTHMVYNLFALILFGLLLEKFIGSRKFLIIFFVSGIIANLIAVNFYNSSLGASGAIFGIIGALTIIKPKIPIFAFGLPMPLFLAAIFWALGDLWGVFNPSGTGNIAHLAGLAIGLIAGFLFRIQDNDVKKEIQIGGKRIKIPESQIRAWEDRYMR